MAVTGRGNHPLISSWFVPRYNPPSKSLHIMRRSVGIDRDTVDNVVWADFFFESGDQPGGDVTGTISTSQALQSLIASGTVEAAGLTGTVSTSQALQTLAAAGQQSLTGTISVSQVAQKLAGAGQQSLSGTAALSQLAQILSGAGQQALSGQAATSQPAQALSAVGNNGTVVPVTGDIEASQLVLAVDIVGTVSTVTPAVTTGRPERYVIGLPSEVRGRPRRQARISTEQEPQSFAAQGTVFMPIVGISLLSNSEQHLKVAGNKNTFERDMRMIMELVELEVA